VKSLNVTVLTPGVIGHGLPLHDGDNTTLHVLVCLFERIVLHDIHYSINITKIIIARVGSHGSLVDKVLGYEPEGSGFDTP
jgi:hypothetical protein